MTTLQNIIETVGCCYEGSPVPFALVQQYAGCTADEITAAVKAGAVKLVHKVGRDAWGRLLTGKASLFLVPEFVSA